MEDVRLSVRPLNKELDRPRESMRDLPNPFVADPASPKEIDRDLESEFFA
jgi:hypothetical protein